jgi:hypothetical protein
LGVRTIRILAAGVIALTALGCDDGGDASADAAPPPASDASADAALPWADAAPQDGAPPADAAPGAPTCDEVQAPTALPPLTGGGDCAEPARAATAAEWADRGDAVIVARVAAVTGADAPAVLAVSGAPAVTRDTCDGIFRPALRIDLDEVRALRGAPPPSAPIRFGVSKYQDAWDVIPFFLDDCVIWAPGDGTRGIAPGDRIGAVVVHDAASDALVTFGPMFRVGTDDRVTFQNGDVCVGPPAELDGRSLDEVAQTLASLAPPEAPSAGRRAVEGWDHERRSEATAALCFPSEQ